METKLSNCRSRFGVLGSVSLSLGISVFLGVSFTLIVASGVRYVTAQHAVEQALEATLRCLTNAGGPCVGSTPTFNTSLSDWYLERQGLMSTTWADRYQYEAYLGQQKWEATYSGFRIHQVQAPLVEATLWRVPVGKFIPAANEYEYRFWRSRAELERRQPELIVYPRYARNFPEFDPAYENIKRDQAAASWSPRELVVPGDVRGGSRESGIVFQEQTFEKRHLRVGRAEVFISQWIEVPELNIPDGTIVYCDDPNNPDGRPCSVMYAAGGAGQWQKKAYAAVKAFARVTPSANNNGAEVKWAGSDIHPAGTPNGWGLQLETVSKDRLRSWKSSQGSSTLEADHTECLGGRDWSSVGGGREFNLVLRGAIKRRKSDNKLDLAGDAACPGGDKEHWGLEVERGGAYRVRGWLLTKDGDADAEVMFRTYTDSIERRSLLPAEKVTCELSGQLNADSPLAPTSCDSLSRCFPTATLENYLLHSCKIETTAEPKCFDSNQAKLDRYAFLSSPVGCSEAVSLALCSDSIYPSSSPTCNSLPENRKLCGWTKSEEPVADFVSEHPFAECPNSVPEKRELACGDGRGQVVFRRDGDYGDPRACPNLAALSERLATELAPQLEALTNLRQIRSGVAAEWKTPDEFAPPLWVDSVFAVDELGRDISQTESAISAIVSRTNKQVLLKRLDDSWRPELGAFGFSPLEISALSKRGGVSLQPTGIEEVPVLDGYPFKARPEYEIPVIIPEGADNVGCLGKAKTLNERLRYYAAKIDPLVSDPSIWLRSAATYVDSVAVSSLNTCQPEMGFSRAVPPCTPIQEAASSTLSCSGEEYLGRYSDATEPRGPRVCQLANSHVVCRREAVDSAIQESTPIYSLRDAPAREVGFKEIRRHLPGAVEGCRGAGCGRIDIRPSDDLSRVSVQVSYDMSLGFPLDQLGLSKVLTVTESRGGASELINGGRFAKRR